MASPVFPARKRQPNILFVGFFSLVYYGLIVPIDWVCRHIGSRTSFMSRMGKRREKGVDPRILEAFGDYVPTEHDVFVNTFSKSGTNWMLQMAHQIAFRGDGDFANIHDVVCWPDLLMPSGKGKVTVALDDTSVQELSPVSLRVIKTHLSAHHMPYNDKAKYIVVIRDPKDVFVSSYHFVAGIMGRIMPTMQEWLDAYLSDRFMLSFGVTWAEHTASYWALRDKPNVLLLSFREMKKDLEGTVRQVQKFLGVELTDDEFAAVVRKSSFDYMKAIDGNFLPMAGDAMPWMKASMVRSGKAGGSGELITPEQQKRIDAFFLEQFRAMGCDFPYADYCRIAKE